MKYRLSLATIAARLSVAPTSTAVAFTSNPAFTSSSATHVYRSPSFSVKRPTARTYARATSPLFSSPPTRYLLSYDYIPDVLEKRGPYREGHLGLAKQMLGDEVAVSGGPTLTPGESVPSGVDRGNWKINAMQQSRVESLIHDSIDEWDTGIHYSITEERTKPDPRVR
eukprot:scaffold783_cov197-Alexandrium_tamarense.AAC.6